MFDICFVEPPLPGQKSSTSSWKRPSSAAEADRRRTVAKGQTPSGSDEDKDRRLLQIKTFNFVLFLF